MAYTTIDDPTIYFNTVLYTGNATDDRSISGVGFQPDFVWLKRRDTTGSHRLVDSIRGATKTLISNGNNAEGTEADVIQAFESDGIQIGADSASNANSGTFVLWNWKAGGSSSSNSDGSVTSTVSVNTTFGFSIARFTGTGSNLTIGHGLGVKPDFIIVKSDSSSSTDWTCYHSSLGATKRLKINDTASASTNSTTWQDTEPTTSVISIGTSGDVNVSSGTHIVYSFANKKGAVKCGSYTGNNNNDGPFVYLGFKPAWVLFKSSSSGQHWHLIDNKRETFNDEDAAQLSPNNNSSEATVKSDRGTAKVDFLSNGFKIRSDGSSFNGTNSMVYIAFADAPFVNSKGIPTTAR